MADTLDQDVHALKEWLRSAWRLLAEPTLTRFERQELRNYMREAEAALTAGLRRLSARQVVSSQMIEAGRTTYEWPGFRILDLNL